MSRNICTLKIGEEISHFYTSTPEYLYDHAPDDIIKKDKEKPGGAIRDFYSIREWLNNYSQQKVKTRCYKNYPEIGMIKIMTIFDRTNFLTTYEEPIPEFNWQLEEGDSIVCGYPCSKATAYFRGRSWHVWYTLDIPYSDGPWKLCGLPGLILKATDSTGEFDFTAIAIEEEHSWIEEKNKVVIPNHPYEKVTPQRMEQMTKLFFDDFFALYRQRDGVERTEQAMKRHEQFGNSLIPDHKKPCLIEYYGEKKE